MLYKDTCNRKSNQ